MSERWVSGYHGEDSLRNKAHRMLGHEMKGAKYKVPESMSTHDHTKMRPYAEGGHAEGGKAEDGKMKRGGHAKHHKLNHGQTDLHIPHREKAPAMAHMSRRKSDCLKHGGTPKLNVETVREFEHMKRGGKSHHHHYAEGGHAEGGKASGGDIMKKGGHAHHTAQHKHHADGGVIQAGGPFGQAVAPVAPQVAQAQQPMRKGGHMKKHKASGGTIYEHHMVGERPSHKRPNFNYESEMRGEKPVRKPSSRHESKRGLDDKNHGQIFAEGGHAYGGVMKRGGHTHHKAAGGETRMAAGGVGKIRHNAATASGKPKGAGRVIRNNLF